MKSIFNKEVTTKARKLFSYISMCISLFVRSHKKWRASHIILRRPLQILSVDLEGVEPSSKQGTRRLSTCLSVISSFSPYPAYGSPIRSPVRKISPRTPGHAPQPASHCRYPDASRTRSGSCRRGTRPRTSLGTGIKVMLLSKITQRVHSYYCHLYV